MYLFLLSLLLIVKIYARDVILSAGIGDYTYQELWELTTSFKFYKSINAISSSSILAYYLQDNGTLGVYNTAVNNYDGEDYQRSLLQYNLTAYPCLYCDSTIGMCSNLSQRIQNMINNKEIFISDSINRALSNGWDGYYVDFEPDSPVNATSLTEFILEWSLALNNYNLTLNIWIGSDTPYDTNLLYNTTHLKLSTMNTYDLDYEEFINTVAQLQRDQFESSRLGFGLLTNYGKSNMTDNYINGTTLQFISQWSRLTNADSLSLWASHIPPDWYEPLISFLN